MVLLWELQSYVYKYTIAYISDCSIVAKKCNVDILPQKHLPLHRASLLSQFYYLPKFSFQMFTASKPASGVVQQTWWHDIECLNSLFNTTLVILYIGNWDLLHIHLYKHHLLPAVLLHFKLLYWQILYKSKVHNKICWKQQLPKCDDLYRAEVCIPDSN